MTKVPISGSTKTRLQPHLSSEQCVQLHQAFLLDILDTACCQKDIEVFVAFSPPETPETTALSDLLRLVHHPVIFFPQEGEDLGARMHNATMHVFDRGFNAAVIVGADSPTLQPDHFLRAFSSLETGEADVIIGPSRDGGYYLLAVGKPQLVLFEEIDWSTDKVLTQTLIRAKMANLAVQLIEGWYDIDTIDDLRLLFSHLKYLQTCSDSSLPKRTLQLLPEICSQLGFYCDYEHLEHGDKGRGDKHLNL